MDMYKACVRQPKLRVVYRCSYVVPNETFRIYVSVLFLNSVWKNEIEILNICSSQLFIAIHSSEYN